MTNMELVLNMLAEVSSTEISKSSNSSGYDNVKSSVLKGGNVAKNAREQIEKETGKKIVTSNNNKDMSNVTLGTADKPVVMWKDYLELKDNGITIADTESAAIAYICKANNVECIVIKGISDFPKNESESTKEDSHEEQLNVFLTNIPIIMNDIVDNYLEFAIKNHFDYS